MSMLSVVCWETRGVRSSSAHDPKVLENDMEYDSYLQYQKQRDQRILEENQQLEKDWRYLVTYWKP